LTIAEEAAIMNGIALSLLRASTIDVIDPPIMLATEDANEAICVPSEPVVGAIGRPKVARESIFVMLIPPP
jgi:hypothetical protein